MDDWSYDLSTAPIGVEILVSHGELMSHDSKAATRLNSPAGGDYSFVDACGTPVPLVYAWMRLPPAASFNEPE